MSSLDKAMDVLVQKRAEFLDQARRMDNAIQHLGVDAELAIAHQGRQSAKKIKEVARAAQDPLAGTLSLGMIPTIAPSLIPRIVPRLRDHLPKLKIQYQEDIRAASLP